MDFSVQASVIGSSVMLRTHSVHFPRKIYIQLKMDYSNLITNRNFNSYRHGLIGTQPGKRSPCSKVNLKQNFRGIDGQTHERLWLFPVQWLGPAIKSHSVGKRPGQSLQYCESELLSTSLTFE